MEEIAKAAAANERKRSDSELLSEMISKLTNKPDKQNCNSDDAELENKMVNLLHAYVVDTNECSGKIKPTSLCRFLYLYISYIYIFKYLFRIHDVINTWRSWRSLTKTLTVVTEIMSKI